MAEVTDTPVASSSTEDQQIWNRWKSILHCDFETGEITWLERPNNPAFNAAFAGKKAKQTKMANGYAVVRIEYKLYLVHRVMWFMAHRKWPADQIDHIDGVKANNGLGNLREATSLENHRNLGLSRKNTSGHMGVVRVKSGWKAQIKDGVTTRHIGRYDTIEEAASAWRAAADRIGYHPNHGRQSVG